MNIPAASVDDALDRNLDDMAAGLSRSVCRNKFPSSYSIFFRLKGLAQGLNSELNEHNDLLDRWTMIRFKERNIGLISIPLKSERYQCPTISFLRVNDKSEGVGFKVEKQNKAMEKILKK